ncbi:tRNA pseudouridine(13) synthase TruD [Candidatus Woesearchaeota archaeon]|nr:tRNA pseudouridine(13) synthase TruD [Candidatus Woesearchaeota archaeon]
MYKIKQLSEDFVVKEIITPRVVRKDGFLLYWMHKKEYTTSRAVHAIARALKIPPKFIGYAGNKDKNAVTQQLISVKGVPRKRVDDVSIKDIQLEYEGVSDSPISLGDHEGNSFEIIVRNIAKKDYDRMVHNKDRVPNFFGEQRFSKNNAEVGKLLVKKQFRKAAEILKKGSGEQEKKIKHYLEENKNDHVGAIRTIPKKTLRLYVHAYQSKLWNQTAEQLLKKKHSSLSQMTNIKVPIIGFGTDLKDKQVKETISRIMKKEKISKRDFIIKQIPELSAEGGERYLFTEPRNLDIGVLEDDEMNKKKKKVLLRFILPKGSYATVVVKYLLA